MLPLKALYDQDFKVKAPQIIQVDEDVRFLSQGYYKLKETQV